MRGRDCICWVVPRRPRALLPVRHATFVTARVRFETWSEVQGLRGLVLRGIFESRGGTPEEFYHVRFSLNYVIPFPLSRRYTAVPQEEALLNFSSLELIRSML